MINRQEVMDFSREFGLAAQVIEKDYTLRRTREGNILLHAIRHEDGQPRSYRVDRIQGASATNVSFSPRYAIELTASGSLHTPETERASTRRTSSWDIRSNDPT